MAVAGLSMGALLALVLARATPELAWPEWRRWRPAVRFRDRTLNSLRAVRAAAPLLELLRPWVRKDTTDLLDDAARAEAPVLRAWPSARLRDLWEMQDLAWGSAARSDLSGSGGGGRPGPRGGRGGGRGAGPAPREIPVGPLRPHRGQRPHPHQGPESRAGRVPRSPDSWSGRWGLPQCAEAGHPRLPPGRRTSVAHPTRAIRYPAGPHGQAALPPRNRSGHHRHARAASSTTGWRSWARRTGSSRSTSRRPGWVEHDLREIWTTVERCCKKGLARCRRPARHRDGHRHHQPARDDRRCGTATPASRWTARSSGRTGAPRTCCAELKARGRGAARPRDDRARARPVLLARTKLRWLLGPRRGAARPGRGGDALLRHHRHLAGLPAHRRRARTSPTSRTRAARS